MKYKGFTIKTDNSFYKYGQHAAAVYADYGTAKFDSFTAAIGYVRAVFEHLNNKHHGNRDNS